MKGQQSGNGGVFGSLGKKKGVSSRRAWMGQIEWGRGFHRQERLKIQGWRSKKGNEENSGGGFEQPLVLRCVKQLCL